MSLTSAIIILFLVMDPLGNITLFLSALKHVPPRRHNFIILRETLIAFIVLAAFMFFGQYFLNAFQISAEALGITGGMVLFIISIRMIFPPPRQDTVNNYNGEPFIVPLAIPLTAGPASMATVMLFASSHPTQKMLWLFAIIIASLLTLLVMLSSRFISKIFGERGLTALEKLMGLLLTATAIQMLLNGIHTYFKLK